MDTILAVFKAIKNSVKNQKIKTYFYGYNIQVSVHLELKLPGQHIYQRGDIPSSTAPAFSLGHNMVRFAPFVLGSTQLLHHFVGSKKVAKKKEIMMSCTRLYVGSTER